MWFDKANNKRMAFSHQLNYKHGVVSNQSNQLLKQKENSRKTFKCGFLTAERSTQARVLTQGVDYGL